MTDVAYVENEAGWRLTTAGEYLSPLVEKDGRWVQRADVEWATVPTPTPASPDRAAALNQEMAAALVEDGGTSFVVDGVTVTILYGPTLDPLTGAIRVGVQARFLGRALEVGDGDFLITGMPLDLHDNPLTTFRREFARQLLHMNDLEVGS